MNSELIMENNLIRGPLAVRITFIGNNAVGKTSIINRIINNTFTTIYEPTVEIENFAINLNISEDNVVKKTYVMINLEDMFALNNPLLQTPECFVLSKKLKDQRYRMAECLKKVIMTANDKRKAITEKLEKKTKDVDKKDDKNKNLLHEFFNQKKNPEIERLGFVFVIDPMDKTSFDTVKDIFDKMHELEKRSNLSYSKCFFINKIDLIKSDESKESVKEIIKEIKEMKESFNLESSDYYLMSALNGRGVIDSLKKFIAKIHQKQSEERQKEGIAENNIDDAEIDFEVDMKDKVQLFSRKVFCGNNLFACLDPVNYKIFFKQTSIYFSNRLMMRMFEVQLIENFIHEIIL